MMPSTEEVIRSTPWADATLLGFWWADGGRDVILHIELGSGQGRWVACKWATGVAVQLSHKEGEGGYALTWDATFGKNDDGTWSAVFDFARVGEIRLRCNEIDLLTLPPS